MYFDREKLSVYQESIELVAARLPRLQSPFSGIRDRIRLGTENKSKIKSKSKSLDYEYVREKARTIRMSQK